VRRVVVAVIVTSAAVDVLDWGRVATVGDLAAIPRSLPLPAAPPLRVARRCWSGRCRWRLWGWSRQRAFRRASGLLSSLEADFPMMRRRAGSKPVDLKVK
jgi:hypothetical protein